MGELFTPDMFTPREGDPRGRVFYGMDTGAVASSTMLCTAIRHADGAISIVAVDQLIDGRVVHEPHRAGGRRHWHTFDGTSLGPPNPPRATLGE